MVLTKEVRDEFETIAGHEQVNNPSDPHTYKRVLSQLISGDKTPDDFKPSKDSGVSLY